MKIRVYILKIFVDYYYIIIMTAGGVSGDTRIHRVGSMHRHAHAHAHQPHPLRVPSPESEPEPEPELQIVAGTFVFARKSVVVDWLAELQLQLCGGRGAFEPQLQPPLQSPGSGRREGGKEGGSISMEKEAGGDGHHHHAIRVPSPGLIPTTHVLSLPSLQ